MAAGDILGVTLKSDRYGSYADIEIDGLSTGGTYNFGTPTSIDTANLIVIVTSEGFDSAGNATLVQRTLFGTVRGRKPHPNNAQAEETNNGSSVTIRCWLSGYVYDDDKDAGAIQYEDAPSGSGGAQRHKPHLRTGLGL